MCFRRSDIAILLLLLLLLDPAGFRSVLEAAPEGYPRKPVKVIVPFAPGGGSDTFARLVQRTVRREGLFPEPWVVVNIPGAGGTIGSRVAKRSRPDGHTLLFLHDGILTAHHAGRAGYGPEAFEPIAITGRIGLLVAVSEHARWTRLGELLRDAAAEPETVTFAANIGAPSHFMALMLEDAHGEAAFRYVQSGGGAKRFADLKGGHVAASAFSVAEYLSFREGGLRALAYLGEERHPAIPEVPTAGESGCEVAYGNLQGWWAPGGTPAHVIEKVEETLRRALETPEMQRRLATLAIDPLVLTGNGARERWRERDAQLARVSPEVSFDHLPRFPLVLGCLAGLAAAGMLLSSRREIGRTLASASPLAGTETGFPPHWKRGAIALLLTIAYAGALMHAVAPFLPATVAFVVAIALAGSAARSLRSALTWAIAGLLLGVICQLFFTRLLGIELS